MSKAFAALLARRFAPLDFLTIPGFPHPIPSIDIWGDHLPRFAEKKEDNPSDHLIRFHQCMVQLNIHDEDVLMKMFMYLLEGDAHEWYRSLLFSSISSLKKNHTTFHHRCERFFSQEFLLEHYCEEFMLYDKDESFSSSSSSHYCTYEKLIIPITNHTDQLPISQIELTTNVGSHQISDLQIKGNHNRYGDKYDDQIFKLVCDSSRSATKVELPTFNTEISERSQQRQQHFSSQLKQQEYHFSP